MAKKRKKLHGTVEKVIKSRVPNEPEKAEIRIEEADDLYREIRIENVLENDKGEASGLPLGKKVDVIVETDTDPKQHKPKG